MARQKKKAKEPTPSKKQDEISASSARIRIERGAADSAQEVAGESETKPENQPKRRFGMAADERTERARERAEEAHEEYQEMAKTWKAGYLSGLESVLEWQAQNERLFKDVLKQQISGSRQLLTMWKDWVQRQANEQERIHERITTAAGNGATNPLLGLTRQSTEAVVATVEPMLKTSEAAMDSTFGYYESALAAPSRKYVREINKQVLDAVIPG